MWTLMISTMLAGTPCNSFSMFLLTKHRLISISQSWRPNSKINCSSSTGTSGLGWVWAETSSSSLCRFLVISYSYFNYSCKKRFVPHLIWSMWLILLRVGSFPSKISSSWHECFPGTRMWKLSGKGSLLKGSMVIWDLFILIYTTGRHLFLLCYCSMFIIFYL